MFCHLGTHLCPFLSLCQKGNAQLAYRRILRLQARFLSPSHSILTPSSHRSFSCRSSSLRLEQALSTEARSEQYVDVRPHSTSLHGRCSLSAYPGLIAFENLSQVSLCEPWHAKLPVVRSLLCLFWSRQRIPSSPQLSCRSNGYRSGQMLNYHWPWQISIGLGPFTAKFQESWA